MLPDLFIQQLKQYSDIERVVSGYVQLKKKGRYLVGLCPFHSEKSGSFFIYPQTQSFYCFGCGAGGDVITFIRRIENLEYMEAVKFLADKCGLEVPENGETDSRTLLKKKVLEINRESARFFHNCLMSDQGKGAYQYLIERGRDRKTIRHFGLGYAPDDWYALVNHLKSKGYTEQEMIEANVAVKGKKGNAFDRFRNRVMFPIIDLRGNVVAFGGRALDDKGAKYLNSSDTPVFKKSKNLFASFSTAAIPIMLVSKIGLLKDGKTVRDYYYHSVSHSLGLDCHDVTTPSLKTLRPGMVITVEPGLYIEEEGIGVRIEDDIIITEEKAINLSSNILKTVEDIEDLMKK